MKELQVSNLGKTLLLKATIGTCLLAASSLAAAFEYTHQSSKIVPNHESCDVHDSSTTLRATYAFTNANATKGIWCLRWKGGFTKRPYNTLSNSPVGAVDLTTSNDAVMTSVRFWLGGPSCGRGPCGWVTNFDGWESNNWSGTRKSYFGQVGGSGGWDLTKTTRSVRLYTVNSTE